MLKRISKLIVATVALAALAPPARVPAADGDGFVDLFNGKDLKADWVQYGGQAKYRLDKSKKEIVGSSVPNTSNSFLCTKKHYGDFILELEFNVHPDLNSGVQVRSHLYDKEKTYEWQGKKIKVEAGRVHGYQVEIDPDVKKNRMWTAGIYDEGRRAWLKDLKDNEPARKAFKPGEWNKFRIECQGDSIKTWLNGVVAAELKDSMTPKGFIGLQVHGVGGKTEPLEVRFRNLRIKELK